MPSLIIIIFFNLSLLHTFPRVNEDGYDYAEEEDSSEYYEESEEEGSGDEDEYYSDEYYSDEESEEVKGKRGFRSGKASTVLPSKFTYHLDPIKPTLMFRIFSS